MELQILRVSPNLAVAGVWFVWGCGLKTRCPNCVEAFLRMARWCIEANSHNAPLLGDTIKSLQEVLRASSLSPGSQEVLIYPFYFTFISTLSHRVPSLSMSSC
eukprot:TRINITY_DN110564_c0_g1_i1.p1 TRINITY_DN110564_c0_g1~~TRINITY_DN110564_c0_g1_i1.p1  ORF type:complete len:103 (-),score=11.89 TRINITY_DN110564_c0_g1_i1:145-453(-)